MKKNLLPYFFLSPSRDAGGENSMSLLSARAPVFDFCAQNNILSENGPLASCFRSDADDIAAKFSEYHPNNSTLRDRNPHYRLSSRSGESPINASLKRACSVSLILKNDRRRPGAFLTDQVINIADQNRYARGRDEIYVANRVN